MKRIHQVAIGTALTLPMLFPPGIHAQEANDRSDEINAIIRGLDVEEVGEAIFNIKAARSVSIKVGRKKHNIMVDYDRSIDLTVFFAYNSDRLTKKGREELDKLGAALNSKELKPQHFLIAGHTDAKGSNTYNLGLSQRRARAVRGYLVRNWSIGPNRLIVHGWGETRLKDRIHPKAAINRRVEVSYILPREVVEKFSKTTVNVDGEPVLKTNTGGVNVEITVMPPAASVPTVTIESDPEAIPTKDCTDTRLNDPRPLQAPIDDFGGKRTPLPCGNDDKEADRVKLKI